MKKTYLWWKLLCLMAVINIGIWIWSLSAHWELEPFSWAQPALSGLYVLVCAFRSFYPRIDLERYCLIDSPLSSIALGRSLATIAEIAFSAQCAILIYDLGHYLGSPMIITIAWLLVPLIVIAQLCCWRAALTLNHFWHGVEEALWVVMVGLTAICCAFGFFLLDGWPRLLMVVGILSCIGAGYVMLVVDIPMYFARFRDSAHKGVRFLGIGEGAYDALTRRIQTSDWAVWKQEVLWISTYFTFGVWLSIGMIFVRF